MTKFSSNCFQGGKIRAYRTDRCQFQIRIVLPYFHTGARDVAMRTSLRLEVQMMTEIAADLRMRRGTLSEITAEAFRFSPNDRSTR
jgi:hypothetical protein